jgi:MATE family multidrug resistance protein
VTATEAPSTKLTLRGLLTLAWPIMLSRMSQSVIGLSDVWLVADLGAAALAATATGALNAFALLILPIGVMFVVSSFASQLAGAGDPGGARRFAWYGLIIAGLTQVGCIAVLPFISWLVDQLPNEPEVQTLMRGYLLVRLLSGGAAVGIEALSNFYGGLGRTRPGMVAAVSAMVLNVLGNVMFIGGRFGAPKLGVTGSALASTLATAVAFVGFFIYFLRDAHEAPGPLRRAEFMRLLRFGLPSGFNWLFEFLAFIFFINVVVAGLGTEALAAMNAVFNLNSVAFMPAFGLASACAIVVGQAIGAGRKDDVPAAIWLTVRSTIAWEGFVGLFYLAAPALLMQPFAKGPTGPQVEALGVRMLLVSAAWQVFDAVATVMAESLRAAGDTLFPLVMRLAIAWLVFAPGAYFSVTRLHWTEIGATGWMVAYLALLAISLTIRYRTGRWRSVVLIDPLASGH